MKALVFVLSMVLVPSFCFASNAMDFRCTAGDIETCAQKVFNELEAQKCVYGETVTCNQSSDAIYCTALSENCSDAYSDGFIGVLCGSGKKGSMKDPQLSATWALTFLTLWVRDICVPE